MIGQELGTVTKWQAWGQALFLAQVSGHHDHIQQEIPAYVWLRSVRFEHDSSSGKEDSKKQDLTLLARSRLK